jgi:polar amino acid transport system substrate-binding protein
MKRLLLLVVLVFSLSLVRAGEPEPLRVGIAPSSPPFQFKEKNKVVGLEADFAEKLGLELGRKIEFVEMNFDKLLPSLMNNEIDIIMAGMSVTRIRDLQVAFSNPYMAIGQMPLVRLEDKNKFVMPFDVVMTDKKVGAKEHTTSEYLVAQEFPKAKKTFFKNHAQAVSALKSGKIDLLILDSPYVLWLSIQNEGKLTPVPLLLTEENLAWAVRKKDEEFLITVNRILEKWKKSGELNAMIKARIPGFN